MLAAFLTCANAIAGGPLIDNPKDAVAAQLRVGDEILPPVKLSWPLCAKLGSGFGYRVDPFLGKVAFHSGLDSGDTFGAEVRASHDGQIVAAERRGPYGLMIELVHDANLGTRYGQLQMTLVKPGERVMAGQVIARVGSTGRSKGPHLHFEVWRGTHVWDPRTVLPPPSECGRRRTASPS